MDRRVRISTDKMTLHATLNDSATANAIWEALPFESKVSTWGDEIYFSIPVEIHEAEDARQDMKVGELGYWPGGSAFCIFFGPTPASEGDVPRAYTNVNPFGQVEGDATPLKSVEDGEKIRVEGAS